VSDKSREGNLLVLALIAAFRGIRDNFRTVIWQPYALSLGVSVQGLGILESVMDVTRLIVQPILGAASDSYGRKKFLIFREVISILVAFCLLFASSWYLLAVAMFLVGLNWAFLPVWNSTIAESSDSSRVGYFFSIIGSSFMGAGLIGTLSAGYIAQEFGYSLVFIISILFGLSSLILVTLSLKETQTPSGENGFTLLDTFKPLLLSFKPAPHLRGFYVTMAVDLFAFGLGYRLLNGMLSESYGYTPYMLGLMSTVRIGVMAVSQIIVGRFVDRIGYHRCLAASQTLACVFLGMIVYSKSFPFILGSSVLMGFASALWMPAEQSWIVRNVKSEERAQSIGGYATFRALFSFPGPAIGGYLYEVFGFDVPIMANLVLWLFNTVMILILVKPTEK
jgi:MFS family permease